ncbi:heavy-metal-associated domain-containing protein [Brevirhabdus sp.]|uniref:heavy-metal-associated domain-containing protein n=1 Tax=Brevirhabdus sp. TaxID=2004514 RepID=UPI0040593B75
MCGCSSKTQATAERTTRENAVEFHVGDMTCGHCEKAIRSALAERLPGAAVDVDLSRHVVRVDGDAAVVKEAITAAGYTPEMHA